MQTKLTLRLDDQLIGQAKRYADRSGKSVSQLVAEYFALLDPVEPTTAHPITPRVQALLGVLNGEPNDEGDYREYLKAKHQ
jgi:hypothetical protein